MRFSSYDEERGTLKRRCLQSTKEGPACHYYGCDDSLGYAVDLKIADDYRRFCQVPRASREWNTLYNLRVSVGRVFGRLKGFRALDCVTLRGLDKVELHCLLSIIVMQAMALGKATQEALSEVKNNVRKVA